MLPNAKFHRKCAKCDYITFNYLRDLFEKISKLNFTTALVRQNFHFEKKKILFVSELNRKKNLDTFPIFQNS